MSHELGDAPKPTGDAPKPKGGQEPKPRDKPDAEPPKDGGFYTSYSEFSKTLRTWFVAYGIGGPVVLLSNETAWASLKSSGVIITMGLLFLLGGVLQIIGALLNKHSMWYLYVGENNRDFQRRCPYRLSSWYSEQGWVDVVLDSSTIFLFGWATLLAFASVADVPPAAVDVPSQLKHMEYCLYANCF